METWSLRAECISYGDALHDASKYSTVLCIYMCSDTLFRMLSPHTADDTTECCASSILIVFGFVQ
jgi:hypothetical protein